MRWRTWSWHAPLVRAARNGLVRAMTHVLVLIGGYELYRGISIRAPHRPALAHAHAGALIAMERRLGIAIEPRLQHAALHDAWPGNTGLLTGTSVRHLVTLVYAGSQLQWLAAMLLWLYLFQRPHFASMRNLVLATTLLTVTFATLYPVAPPRFALAGPPYHIEDVSAMLVSEQALVRHGGFNPYAAVPSLHVLWALIAALGLWVSTPRWDLRVLSCLFPASIIAAVIITGNHYVLDCLASVLLLTGLLLCYWSWLWLCRARRAPVVRGDAAPTERLGGPERRQRPNLRPLDCPVLLCAITGAALIPSVNPLQRVLGMLLLVAGALAPAVALKRIRAGTVPHESTPTLEWWSGFLLLAGATTLGANDVLAQEIGSLCWTVAALLPLLARMRGQPLTARETRRTEVGLAATHVPPSGSG